MAKALEIRPNGQVISRDFPENTYHQIAGIVGGTIAAVYSKSGNSTFYIHDEGKLMGLMVNEVATELWWELNPNFRGHDFLVGTVVLFGGADEEGMDLDVDEEATSVLDDWMIHIEEG